MHLLFYRQEQERLSSLVTKYLHNPEIRSPSSWFQLASWCLNRLLWYEMKLVFISSYLPHTLTWAGLKVFEYKGGSKFPIARFDVLVTTPMCFLELLHTFPTQFSLNSSCISLIVFDEVHYTIKKHPYAQVGEAIRREPESLRPLILGLTAHLTYPLEERRMTRAIRTLINFLGITVVETAQESELEENGYHAHIRCPPRVVGSQPCVIQSKDDFFNLALQEKLSPFSQLLVKTVEIVEQETVQKDSSFTSYFGTTDENGYRYGSTEFRSYLIQGFFLPSRRELQNIPLPIIFLFLFPFSFFSPVFSFPIFVLFFPPPPRKD
eukprot:TRINITY_DN11124_c0_g1_i1.p1 TRINITY_DN11124_c0_g1~~TRINITY_DN11124_c0_g1_i1.p1  ORF type:complete len:322 (+),score=37.11 TRINITY_DN11124_c0_g1_i1:320-1285(+)